MVIVPLFVTPLAPLACKAALAPLIVAPALFMRVPIVAPLAFDTPAPPRTLLLISARMLPPTPPLIAALLVSDMIVPAFETPAPPAPPCETALEKTLPPAPPAIVPLLVREPIVPPLAKTPTPPAPPARRTSGSRPPLHR